MREELTMPAAGPPADVRPDSAQASRFLRACRRQPVDATPIWFMRQAGRVIPEYHEIQRKHGFFEIVKTPDLACLVTLQPIQAFGPDAAIVFADILPLLEAMGVSLEIVRGEGPLIHNPLRCAADVDALRVPVPEEALAFTLEAIKLVRGELDGLGIPLIGFSGAPFTLASYAVEGGYSSHYLKTKGLMLGEPILWHRLMTKLAEAVGQYLLAQARAGAQVLQLFDSWVGVLGPGDYCRYVLPYTRQAIAIARQVDVPIIHFGTGTSGMLEQLAAAGGDVIGVDWRIDLDAAWRRLSFDVGVQGNLDPAALLAPWSELEIRARAILDQAAGRPGHIFNLGHGLLPETPVDNLRRLVAFVHEASSSGQ
jgi:uroporphyrinogen decarboxylase